MERVGRKIEADEFVNADARVGEEGPGALLEALDVG